jgi:hypothetical protein
MTRIVGNIRDLKGIDYAHAKWEFDNKMPSHLFYVIYSKDETEYNNIKQYIIQKTECERKVNDLLLLEIDYDTGDISKRVKTMDEIFHYRQEPFPKFVSFFTKKRGFKNKSITINLSDKHRYMCLVFNHSFGDGIRSTNKLLANLAYGCSEETITKQYVYKPFVNELCMMKSMINNVKLTLTTKKSFIYNERMKTIINYVNIDNAVITKLKNELKTSFNYVGMAFVLKYMFEHSDATSLNVLVSFGFKENDKYYNNYTFVVITVKKEDEFEQMVKKIASDIEEKKTDFVGNYEMIHNYGSLEKIFKNDVIDVVYASMLWNEDKHYSNYIVNANPTMPVYICVLNSKANIYSNVVINIKTTNVFLKNNDFIKPEMLKTSKYL